MIPPFNKKYYESIKDKLEAAPKSGCLCGNCPSDFKYPDLTVFDHDLFNHLVDIDVYRTLRRCDGQAKQENQAIVERIFEVAAKNIVTDGYLCILNLSDLFISSECPHDEIVYLLLVPNNLVEPFMAMPNLKTSADINLLECSIGRLWTADILKCVNMESDLIVSISQGGRIHGLKVP